VGTFETGTGRLSPFVEDVGTADRTAGWATGVESIDANVDVRRLPG